jgi:opacity protein-like surface antigen
MEREAMKSTICAVVCSLMMLPAVVAAQGSVDGTWVGEIQGGRGPQQVTLTLKADGGKLTGAVTGGRGGDVQIQEGTISGSALKFKTTQTGRGGQQVTFNWSGTLKGDEIAFSRMAEGGQGNAQEFVAKRQK